MSRSARGARTGRIQREYKLDGNDNAFSARRSAAFGLFADFLISFVQDKTLPPPTKAGAAAGGDPTDEAPAAPQQPRRRVWGSVGVVVALVLLLTAAIGLGLRLLGDGGGPMATFRFDALGGGSPVISVYPGISDAPADKISNGTFRDGQTTTAVCQTTGRWVRSDPSVGERPRESDVWVRVVSAPGATSYASLTYGSIEPMALAGLPRC